MSLTSEKVYVPHAEQEQVARGLLKWLNQWEGRPMEIEFEYLPKDAAGMSLTTVQGASKTAEYITGDYEAQLQFGVLYRSQPGDSGDRLDAVELLDGLAQWIETQETAPEIGAGRSVTAFETNSAATLIARYQDGSEDYQLLMTMQYEVRL